MWTSTSMGVSESVLLSVMGFSVVMVTPITLALVILVFAKVMGSSNAAVQSAPRPIPDPPGISDEVCSMILAVICEEPHASPEGTNVTSIKELK